ncbi:MAG: TolC family protein [Oscillibacter sp.]|nr:TolC family protein [Oscillibacter sp.]
MKKRLLALAVMLALLFACAAPAMADEGDVIIVQNKTAEETQEPENSAAGPDDREDRKEYVADEVGFVSFENIERRMYKENLKIEMMDATIDTLQEVDYKSIRSQLEAGLAMIDQQVLAMQQAAAMEPIGAQVAITSLQTQAAELEEQLVSIKSGRLQEDNEGIIAQLEASRDALVMGGETMFLALKAMETQDGALQRQLTALNRTVEEMELRYEMGQISALQLAELKAGRSSLVSGMKTLQMNIEVYKSQLEQFLGAKITGDITLGAVPEVTEAQIAAMDVEKDWKACRRQNYDIYAADIAAAQAEEDFEKAEKAYDEDAYEYRAAENALDAAEATYQDTVQTKELSFRSLYAQVLDCKQILENARVSLQCEEEAYRASELKYQQGTISQNALLTAEDELRAAQETVENAANDLFAAYNTYCWAAGRGILN